ncbi:hypothetical protein SPRG_11283 [Saprolegnia parasitica CBS 223.65]|uniref:Uncharacterized protein n=1 Tax=Saprolegnia parasitica (strain CBS 223.65) TaxID=695850 RepID=A0A067CAK6_SAPPC|nr:hypothetical protein SPRG_11283 [Saprolegnia parasitica CBS 223.65]KDO23852.1 hypothetical protein SPRG_11283 [Saprolegnia parasitica CBS 223.65]|eukprot:XP_012205484.1 hypothetical protein SPRG_11283 [Saprolegnia parasitica CBS 223.65]
MAEKAKKQVVKLQKAFLEEVDGCDAIERQGLQALSSLANIAGRLPLVGDASTYGVLAAMHNVETLLTQRHYEGLEKARLAIAQTVEYFFDHVENMQRHMSTCADVFDGLTLTPSTLFLAENMEWMENVLGMYEREAARKKELCRALGYADVALLHAKHAQYLSSSRYGAVNRDYVTLVTDAAKAKLAQAAKYKELPEDDDDA